MTYTIAAPKVALVSPTPMPSQNDTRRRYLGAMLAATLCMAVAGSLLMDTGTAVGTAVDRNATADLIARIAPNQGSVARLNPRADGTSTATTKAGLLTLPSNAADPLMLTADASAHPVTLRLPGAALTSRAVHTHAGPSSTLR